MVNVAEHVYQDDPTDGHPDVRTRLERVSFFFLGDGVIQGAVQFAPGGDGTLLGLLIMDPDRLGKKRDALTMEARTGLASTEVTIDFDGRVLAPETSTLAVSWVRGTTVPTVEARWGNDAVHVVEQFSCPLDGATRLLRLVTVVVAGGPSRPIVLKTGVPGNRVEHTMTVAPGVGATASFEYALAATGARVALRITDADGEQRPASAMWQGRTDVRFNEPLLDHLFDSARWQLPAAVSARGCMDGSIWQYNREWVRDQANVAVALTQLGHRDLAATMLRRLLTEFVTEQGATLDSSEVRSRDDVELDQNGVLLHALDEYVRWTGDAALVADLWPRVKALADYPLGDEFRHAPSGMLSGSREYWERHAAHGIEPGLELAYQMFVSVGLSRAAALARRLGHTAEQQRWNAASFALRDAFLSHPTYALHDLRGFVKRRTLDGRVQESIVASPDSGLPAGVPLASHRPHLLNPDTCSVLPIVYGVVEPASPVAQATMASVEALWNQAWLDGGYGRYHESSEPDSPGGWPFASLFVARAAVETGHSPTVWRILRWMSSVPGGAAGSWSEFYGPRFAPPFPQVGIVPWTWAELVLLFIHHVLGVRPGVEGIHLRPRLLSGLERVEARVPIGRGWLHLELIADNTAPAVSTVIPYADGITRMTIPVRTMS